MDIDYTLYLVADAEFAAGRDLAGLVAAAVAGGATAIQLRGKGLAGGELLALGLELQGRLAGAGIPLIVNDRLDVALACGAAGVHLGQGDVPIALARKLLGSGRVIGVSVNTPGEARRAAGEGADYVGAGPAYATATKETALPVLGPEGVRLVRRAVSIPVVAIGGIDAGNAAALAAAGADGIAVVSAILGAPDARLAAEELKRAFKPQARRERRPQ